MDWTSITSLATALGTIIAGITLISMYNLYRISKRDAYILNVRQIITRTRRSCHKLDQLLTYEISNEFVSIIIRSYDLELPLRDVFNKIKQDDLKKEDFEQYIKEYFPPITVPIHTPILEVYENLLEDLEQDVSFLQTEYPGLFRIIKSIQVYFSAVINNNKELIRDTELWAELLLGSFEDKNNYDNLDRYKNYIFHSLVIALMSKQEENDQPIIDDLIKLIDLTTDAYLATGTKRMYELSSLEKETKLQDILITKEITDDLREAEKALNYLFTNQQLLNYREYVVKIEQRIKT